MGDNDNIQQLQLNAAGGNVQLTEFSISSNTGNATSSIQATTVNIDGDINFKGSSTLNMDTLNVENMTLENTVFQNSFNLYGALTVHNIGAGGIFNDTLSFQNPENNAGITIQNIVNSLNFFKYKATTEDGVVDTIPKLLIKIDYDSEKLLLTGDLEIQGNVEKQGDLEIKGDSFKFNVLGEERMRITNVGNEHVYVTGSVHCTDWLRTTGNGGWYSQTHGGGWYMKDGTWLRSYGGRSVWMDSTVGVGGWMGVGTSGPSYPLHVTHRRNIRLGRHAWFNTWAEYGMSHGYTRNISAYFYGEILANEMLAHSDRRIKKNITLINDDIALKKVNALETCEYNYIDPIRQRPMKTIGFIAQEVKEIIPNAVEVITDFIPDEMRLIENQIWSEDDLGNNILRIDDLQLSSNHTGKCKFYVTDNPDSGEEECETITVEDDKKSFKFDKKWNYIYLHSKEVNDFHSLDKAQIYAIHHGAIQELSRINDNKTEKINVLEEDNKALKIKVAKLESDMAFIKQKLGM